MAELIGLIASIAQLAGAAAAVSLTLFECGRTLRGALGDIDGLAADAGDVSGVLEQLGDVLQQHSARVAAKTTAFVARQMARCEKVVEQLRVTAELARGKFARVQWLFRKAKAAEMKLSLEAFKSNLMLVIQTLMLAKALDDDAERYCRL